MGCASRFGPIFTGSGIDNLDNVVHAVHRQPLYCALSTIAVDTIQHLTSHGATWWLNRSACGSPSAILQLFSFVS